MQAEGNEAPDDINHEAEKKDDGMEDQQEDCMDCEGDPKIQECMVSHPF